MGRISAVAVSVVVAASAAAQEPSRSTLRFGVACGSDAGRSGLLEASREFGADFAAALGARAGAVSVGPRLEALESGGRTTPLHDAALRYGSTDLGGVRFLRLDAGPGEDGAPRLGEAQLDWLRYEIRTSPRPLVLLSTEGPTGRGGIADGEHVRAALRETEPWRVLAWFHGGGEDLLRWLDGIPALSLPSVTLRGEQPPFALVELDLGARRMHVSGRVTPRSFALPAFGASRYHSVDVQGWWVQFGAELTAHEALRAEVHELLDAKLQEVAETLPPAVVARLRAVPLWMHADRRGARGGLYHPSLAWLGEHELDPRWAGGVEFANAMNFLTWIEDQPSMVLHELSHAWHHQVLGYGDAALLAAFERAAASGRYESVEHASGERRRAYALEDVMEFFAEASEAWWGRNDFEPFDRAALIEFDPETARAVEAAWSRVPDAGQ